MDKDLDEALECYRLAANRFAGTELESMDDYEILAKEKLPL